MIPASFVPFSWRASRSGALIALTLLAATSACSLKPRGAGSTPRGSGAAPRFVEHRISAAGRAPFGVTAADFDRDGRIDLAVSNTGSNAVQILQGRDELQFATAGVFPAGQVPRGIASGDLNEDGNPDVVAVAALSRSLFVMLGDGKGQFSSRTYLPGFYPFTADVVDLDGDGHQDVIVANESNVGAQPRGDLSVFYGDGTGALGAEGVLVANRYPSDVETGDLDGDGRRDVVATNWGSHDVSIFLNQGARHFSEARNLPIPGEIMYTVVIADLNGDHLLDIATADVIGRAFILTNRGGAQFEVGSPLPIGNGTRCMVASDLNGDGLVDLATADTNSSTASILIQQADHSFAPAMSVPVGARPRSVIAVDVNQDGRPDLIVTDGGSDEISLLINTPQ